MNSVNTYFTIDFRKIKKQNKTAKFQYDVTHLLVSIIACGDFSIEITNFKIGIGYISFQQAIILVFKFYLLE